MHLPKIHGKFPRDALSKFLLRGSGPSTLTCNKGQDACRSLWLPQTRTISQLHLFGTIPCGFGPCLCLYASK